jgi:hypothetical protein
VSYARGGVTDDGQRKVVLYQVKAQRTGVDVRLLKGRL